jgi:hypothetical protein
MADRWPFVCSLFGLVGVAPLDTQDPKFCMPIDFMEKHSNMVEKLAVTGIHLKRSRWKRDYRLGWSALLLTTICR